MQIIVIGAGMAGLAGANTLQDKGFSVTVLEANNRIGGRIWTDYSLGIPFDLGASWIHGIENNPITTLANQSHARYMLTNFTEILFATQTKKIIAPELFQQLLAYFEGCFEEAIIFSKNGPHDISLAEAFHHICPPEKVDPPLREPWNWLLKRLSLYYNADISDLSARLIQEEERLPGGNYIILDGYETLINELAKKCTIKLNQCVKKIIIQQEGVEVVTQQGSEKCDAVLMTVPLSILKNNLIEFDPHLPHFKLQALKNLEMGLLNKIGLKFPKAFWPEEYFLIHVPSVSEEMSATFLNYSQIWNKPILTSYFAGNQAKQLETWTDDALIETTVANLKNYFGNSIPQPEKNVITRWGQNPWSAGSYSYIPVGASGEDFDALASPVEDRIFFAGEATYRKHYATTHGAYLSGVREAIKIANFYR